MDISMNDFYAVLAWVLWCSLHSALISISVTEYVKSKIGDSFRYYRLFYNAVSIVTLIPLVYYSHTIRQAYIFRWEGPLVIVPFLLMATSLYLFIVGGRHYSWTHLWGISQIRAGRASSSLADNNDFVVSGIHRLIRHPWYFGGILIVWACDLSVSTILINMVISIYFIIGSILEERKLVREFGEKYREYQQRVSMLIPWRWLKSKIACFC
jgi:protein-S-isoprenylcysteine O-methyltransferase Ste14